MDEEFELLALGPSYDAGVDLTIRLMRHEYDASYHDKDCGHSGAKSNKKLKQQNTSGVQKPHGDIRVTTTRL